VVPLPQDSGDDGPILGLIGMDAGTRIEYLENRVRILEEENVGMTNALYELENRLQSQLDALITYTMFAPNDVF